MRSGHASWPLRGIPARRHSSYPLNLPLPFSRRRARLHIIRPRGVRRKMHCSSKCGTKAFPGLSLANTLAKARSHADSILLDFELKQGQKVGDQKMRKSSDWLIKRRKVRFGVWLQRKWALKEVGKPWREKQLKWDLRD